MKRLINSTTILSMALYIVPPFAAQAQDFPSFIVDGTEVICLPDKKAECPEGAFCIVVKNPKNCEVRAIEAVAAAAAEAAAATQAVTDQAAADQAAADKAAADAAAAAEAAANQAVIDAAAAEKAAADAAAAAASAADKAAADQAAADAAAAEQAAKDQAAADEAAADKAARKAAKKAADEAAAAEAAAAEAAAAAEVEARAAEAAATDAAVVPAADATVDATVEATTTESTTADTAFPTVTVGGYTFICLPDKSAVCPDGAMCVIGKTIEKCEQRAMAKVAAMSEAPVVEVPVTEAPAEDAEAVAAAQAAAEAAAAAAAADPDVTIVDAPEPTEEAVETLETALDTPVETGDAAVEPDVEADIGEAVTADGTLPADAEPSDEATVTTEVVTEEDSRASDEEFDAAPATVAPGKKTGLSDFEKVGLLALGALVIGAMINGNQQVVSNTGDRVVVRQPDGTYVVYKDDNALLREPGSTVRTETFRDGSTRTIVQRVDGSQIVTIRDATGRVLQRVAYDKAGRATVLIDDLQPEVRVDVTTLPKPKPGRTQISVDDTDAELRAQMAADDAAEIGRKFSLRQIRTIPEVRHLAATIDVNNITFETNSSAIQATEAKKLNKLGNLITRLIEANPNEVFLVEGHTDAVGSAASNLALSDRRAESVAKALTEYFGVPPENLVVQGYGEGELKIETLGDERANRRVAVRIITHLLRQSAN